MALSTVGKVLMGVGVTQLALYPLHKRYQARSENEVKQLLEEHRQLIEHA